MASQPGGPWKGLADYIKLYMYIYVHTCVHTYVYVPVPFMDVQLLMQNCTSPPEGSITQPLTCADQVEHTLATGRTP